MEKYKSQFSTCSGPSMFPTLRNGDGLDVKKYESRDDIRIGDIIVYPHPDKDFDVVHRIIKIEQSGVITRGDNNNKVDPYLIKFEDIIGKVLAAKRGRKTLILNNGCKGFIIHKIMLARKFLYPKIIYPLSFLSRLITRSHVLNFLGCFFETKKVTVQTRTGIKNILMYKNKTIGKKLSNEDKWFIKFPYKFFIDERKLK